MHRNLRVRLLALVLISIGLLALVNVLVSTWSLVRIRDHAIVGSTTALRRQAEGYLRRLAQDRARAFDQKLGTVDQIAAITKGTLTEPRPTQQPHPTLALQTTPSGRRYHYATTMVLLPLEGDDQRALDEVAASASLDALLPNLIRAVPEMDRISVLTPGGTMRTFPALNLNQMPSDWAVHMDPGYQLGLTNRLETIEWTAVHPAPDHSKQVISAAVPIYRGAQLQGVVVADVSLGQLTAELERIKLERTGFAFLLDRAGHLVAAPKEGQRHLFGRELTSAEQGSVALDPGRLGASLAEMRAGRSGTATIDLDGRTYLLAYTPVTTLGWTLGLAVPLDEITIATITTTEQIAGIADETQRRSLLVALGALVLVGLAMSAILRRQFARPLLALIQATKEITAGDLRPITIASADEMGQLATSFNTMTEALQASRAEIMAINQRLEQTVGERTADLELAVTQLEKATASQQELLRTLREVSTPVIPVIAGVLVMPLIGQLDDERVRNATHSLLKRIEGDHIHTVLLDLTGVPIIDTQIAQALLQMVAASRLLGAEVLLVGVAPEIAQTIVALGVDMGSLHAVADLQSAVEQMMTKRRSVRPIKRLAALRATG
jgi:anti-anti-sigma regulatory factor/HAMP domain-containing protein